MPDGVIVATVRPGERVGDEAGEQAEGGPENESERQVGSVEERKKETDRGSDRRPRTDDAAMVPSSGNHG
jgi:hypothetical protein